MSEILTWHKVLTNEKKQPYFINIMKFIAMERKMGIIIYPQQKDIFNAFRFTELHRIKVVILGQDPYFRPNQAHGLAFSVQPGVTIPPSLLNIYKELERSIPDFKRPAHGCLESWAHQGVMLLNTVLTVKAGKANSHINLGWEIFTNKVISIINKYQRKVVFLLWGSHAQKRKLLLTKKYHYILEAAHPSPLSAYRGFFGCNHFVLTNKWLEKHNKKPIDWVPRFPKQITNCMEIYDNIT